MALLNVRLSDEDKAKIAVKSKALGMTVSEYIRLVAINAEVSIVISKEALKK